MTRVLFVVVLASFFLIPTVRASFSDGGRDELAHPDHVASVAVGFEAKDNVPTVPPGVKTQPRRGVVWDALAGCECHGDWSCNTGNGYSGGLQMDAPFWEAYGGLEFAAEAWMATREEQIVVAERGRAKRGYRPWPSCAAQLGLI